MVWPAIGFIVSFIPNVYHGLTQGQWTYGWDYVLTGHDYVGDIIDKIMPDDPEEEGDGWQSGLTDGDYSFLTDAFAGLQELITVGIVITLVAFVVFALFRRP